MSIRYGIALGAIMLTSSAALAADTKTNEVTPGKAATEAVGDSVPTMKGECADQAKVDTKAPGTEATEATGSEVPTMKQADASDCVDQPETKSN
jgi:hypothetical protein